ncbi:MAG: radical SAM protein [Phycisphaerae bacterium]|nr:radical SAM protein [Phycisphaerae bacterium]
MKTCSQNCVYCQLGIHGKATLERREYVPFAEVIDELRAWLAEGGTADYITISGSGEPTLYSRLDELVRGIRSLTKLPIAIITNGTLLQDPEVRRACCLADVVMPSLDAGDAETFRLVNRPHSKLDFDSFVRGLIEFRGEYSGQYWLEVFLVDGINTNSDQLANIRAILERIRPDKIQVNTAVRPTAEAGVVRVEPGRLEELARRLSPRAEVIADFDRTSRRASDIPDAQVLVEILRRRPCSLSDLSAALGYSADLLQPILDELLKRNSIRRELRGDTCYFKI